MIEGVTKFGEVIYVTAQRIGTNGGGVISFTAKGIPISNSLITGISQPDGIAANEENLFVADWVSGSIGKYSVTGATIDATLISGLGGPMGIALDGTNLYVADVQDGRVGKCTD